MKIRLGESIRKLRKESGFTQEQLAEALGVSVSAVHKWESGKATPELEMLVDIAEFFETSVDAMLNYGWQTLSMGQTVEKLKQFTTDRKLEEGMQFAEKALQKYPNSFEVVFHSAEIYSLTMDPAYAPRAIELYRRSLSFIDQNTNTKISSLTIQNRIAMCYCYMGRNDEAIKLLKENNVDGVNNFHIALLLSKEKSKAEEALKYFSEALICCYSELYNLCIAYANACSAIGKIDKATEFTMWFYELGRGLWDPSVVTWMDRGNVVLCMILANMEVLRGNRQGAHDWLASARESAQRFDANPEYRTMVGMKFYHGKEPSTSYDDMGETAMSVIENHLADEEIGAHLRAVWEEICAEE